MFTDRQSLKTFLTAGTATLTVKSLKSGEHRTFRVRANENRPGSFFVDVLAGPDNTADYKYLAFLSIERLPKFKWSTEHWTAGSDLTPSGHLFRWFIENLYLGATERIFEQAEFHHDGTCARCGRQLTTPDSIKDGLGPVCLSKE